MKAITANNSICSELHNSWNGERIMKRSCNNLLGGKKKSYFKWSGKLNWRINLKILAKS